MNNILSAKKLTKSYKDFKLDNINFEIPNNSIVGFIGENGAGKTTTIKSILNLINLESGSIEIFNKNFKENESEIKEDIGVVLNDSFLPEGLTIIDINNMLKNMYKNWDEEKYFKYIDRFKLPKDKSIKNFSTGMLVKVKITCALSHNPKLLILDEPTSGLDPIARNEILEIFEEFIEEENHSIFVSSHITSDLEQVADYIIFISNGQIVLNTKIEDLRNNYAIIKCDEKEFNKIKKEDITRFKKTRNDYQILTDNQKEFKKKYKNIPIEKVTIDEIMLLYIKGEKYE